jgi:thymidylate kinase
MVTGLFIVVEGPEGAGKSSLARALATRLVGDGRQVVSVREPGGTPVAEAARKVQDRVERQDDAFHRRVLEAYRRAQGPGVVHLDGTQSKQAVLDAAWREVLAVAALSTRGVS